MRVTIIIITGCSWISVCNLSVAPCSSCAPIKDEFLPRAEGKKRVNSHFKFESFVSTVFITFIMETVNETERHSTLTKDK